MLDGKYVCMYITVPTYSSGVLIPRLVVISVYMGKHSEYILDLFKSEKYPVLFRDCNQQILSSNEAAKEMFHPPEKDKWMCYKAIHNLDTLPASCYCSIGSSKMQITPIYEPSLDEAFQHLLIPIHEDGFKIGSIDIFKTISKSQITRELGTIRTLASQKGFSVQLDNGMDYNRNLSLDELTRKEKEVLEFIMSGIATSEIADAMKISINTVNFHMKNIFAKLGVHNRTQATALVYKHQLTHSETLIREMNHRVKNNFAVLSSLINLRMNNSKNDEIKEALQWIDGQIFSFIKFHDLLMNTTSDSRVPVKKFFEESINHLEETYNLNDRNILLFKEFDDILLHMNIAIPCMQIINELVTNAIRHAFAKMDSAEIHIHFKKSPHDNFTLTISDNGIGMHGSQNTSNAKHLGMRVVESLIKQINGSHSIETINGTRHTIILKQKKCDLPKKISP